MRVLVVEDSKAAREALDIILTCKGHWVKTATTHDEAVALVVIGPTPDAVVVDHHIPGGTGLSFIEYLRNRPDSANVPAALMTADKVKADEFAPEAERLRFKIMTKPLAEGEIGRWLESLRVSPSVE